MRLLTRRLYARIRCPRYVYHFLDLLGLTFQVNYLPDYIAVAFRHPGTRSSSAWRKKIVVALRSEI